MKSHPPMLLLLFSFVCIRLTFANVDRRSSLQCSADEMVCPEAQAITISKAQIPWSEPLVRSRETLIGNLVAAAEFEYMTSR